jgi:hypothetical protein
MSDEKKPVAWHVTGDGYEYSTLLEEHARAVAEEEDGTATPLYRLPTLTDAEREAVERAVAFCECTNAPLPTSDQIATLRALLERTRG